MSDIPRSIVCQRCGRGFVATANHRDLLLRRGIQVKVPVICTTCFVRTGPVPKRQGEVKWFNPRKRYGFIADQEGQDVFLHERQILKSRGNRLNEGQAVRFHVYYSPKGPEAWNVELV
jgi:CspA family cold shock protein